MKFPFQIKLNNRVNHFTQGLYIVLVMVVSVLLLYVGFFENVEVLQSRENIGYHTVDGYESRVLSDEDAPAGICKEFSWTIAEMQEGDNCLAFYMIHETAEVLIDGEIIFQIGPEEGNRIGSSIGCNWAMVPLWMSDVGKEITINIYPIYENVIGNDVTFYVGSQMQIYLDVLEKELPMIILSVVAIITGIVFITMALVDRYLKKKNRNQGYLGMFSVMLGIWRITDTMIAPLIFTANPMVLSYTSLAMLLTMMLAMLLYLKNEFSKRRYMFVDVVSLGAVIVGLIMVLLQATGTADFKETLFLSHIMAIFFVISIVLIMVCEWRREKDNLRLKITAGCFLLCAAGAVGDLLSFYVNRTSAGLQYTLMAFLFYLLVRSILSNRELSRNASIDGHTGLYNKSSCDEQIEDMTILQESTVLFMFDLNHLKRVNDTLGHKAGDKLIKDFADVLRHTIRNEDFLGRYGGDEFIAIAKGASRKNAERILQDIKTAVEEHNQKELIKLSYAAGFAVSVEHKNCTMQMLLEKADENMYIEKDKMHREME